MHAEIPTELVPFSVTVARGVTGTDTSSAHRNTERESGEKTNKKRQNTRQLIIREDVVL